jgi:integrase
MRGQGRVFRPQRYGRQSAVWWLDYGLHGRRFRESARTTSKRQALALLRERIGEREAGKIRGRPDRVVFAEYEKGDDGNERLVGGLRAGLERHYQQQGNRSLARAQQALDHLEEFLGADALALELTKTRVGDYFTHRLAEGAARATVRYEIAILNAAFSVAVEEELLAMRPVFKLPRVENARSGFFEDGDFAALLLELPAYLRPVIRFLRLTGWRKAEVLGLTWDQVDWEGQVIRLAAAQTKGGDARAFPFGLAPDLKTLLEAQWAARDGVFVFQRAGRRIADFRRAWAGATKRAGLTGRLVHDLRRTAARDYRRAGVTEGEIMSLCGWATRAMFDRYNIIDEADRAAAVAKRFNGKLTASLGPPTNPQDLLSSSAPISAA